MRRIGASLFFLAVGLVGQPPAAHAAPALRFLGDPCQFKAQLWSINQDTATRMDTFDLDMRVAYGAANPYTGPVSGAAATPVPLSPVAVADMKALHNLITRPPTGVIPRTWDVARQYGLNTPFTGRADAPTYALRLVFEAEFAFDNAVVAETKFPGGGSTQYRLGREHLARSWTALKAIRCIPAAVSTLRATVQNGWVTFNWQLSSQSGVVGFAVYARSQLLFQVPPSRWRDAYLFSTPYLPGPYVLRMLLRGGHSKSFTFPLVR